MLPSYPSVTFPNHITLVTGLYPEHCKPDRRAYSHTKRKSEYIARWLGVKR